MLWKIRPKDTIPFDHVSAGVCMVSCGMGLCSYAFCIMVAGNEHFFNTSFLNYAQREKVSLLQA